MALIVLFVFSISGFLYYARPRGLRAEGKERDPICGMRSSERDYSAEYKGRTYYFCSKGCRETFREDPEQYLSTKGG